MERVPVTPPLRCFGLEQDQANEVCLTCAHRRECAGLMGALARRVPADQVRFALTPLPLLKPPDEVNAADPDAANLEEVYAFCYEWVFHHKAPNRIGRHAALVLKRAAQSKTSLKLFLLANLLGWSESHPAQRFQPSSLAGEFATDQVLTFAATCRRQFGTFDTTALDQLFGTDIARQDIEALLLNSEMTAGTWIINYQLCNDGHLTKALYQAKELSLNPYWLAIEPSYLPLLLAHVRAPAEDLSPVLRRHRWNTANVLGSLKRRPRSAVAVFNMRERILPEAIRRVLGLRGFQPTDFMVDDRAALRDPLRFWVELTAAIQQFECLNLVEDRSCAFDHYDR
jgi:hypothetical protein